MELESIAFVLGPVLAPFALLVALIQVSSQGWRRTTPLLLVVAAIEAVLVATHWTVWWFAFDWVEGEAIPTRLFDATAPLMIASAVALPGLCWVMLTAARRVADEPSRDGVSIYGPR